ncbi:MAG TPA: HNH endonuclease [Candidatus Limnocylindrales bacterium]|nr:HNH endonuclease [Candidatus Limnocylindrales bacterium]
MNRKQFIQSHGATCDNWNWSWSFVNEPKRIVIFGAWDRLISGRRAKIFSKAWVIDAKGRASKGFKQSLEHIRLIEEEGYKLYTFPMQPVEETWQDDVIPKIKSFTPELTAKKLVRIGDEWFAAETDFENALAEELAVPEKFPEGAKTTVVINAYERNPKARAACIAQHGCCCAACGFNFVSRYGELGKDFIHVHHIKPLRAVAEEYEVDPKKDLVPVCPNCHAMIHRTEPCLSISELREHLKNAS